MDKDSCAFVMYLIHALADVKGSTPGQIYKKLKEYDCINGYLVPCYDVLHTMGTEYLLNDIERFVVNRGGSI